MKNIKFTKEKFGLSVVLVISAILNFANLSIEGYGNEYYAAGVKSMLMNFKNFFFVASDPGGFVSIDKPPLGFWIQTISARIFGFKGWSILLPQALAGVISVGLLYYIVKRSFGKTAAFISALCLAITPVFVAASRNNTIDNLLVMTLLFACMFLSKAAEKGRFKYLLISLVLVGVGFNIKMLEAYMIIPAIYITYLISSAAPVKKRLKHLVISTIVLAAVSLSWAVAVDLVPAQNRPFVGSSTNNTVMELIFGHNGLERLSSSNGGMGGGMGRGNGNTRGEARGKWQQGQMNGFKTGSSSGTKNANMSGSSKGSGMPQMQVPGGTGGSSQKNGGNSGQMSFEKRMGGTQRGGFGGPGGANGLSGNFGGQTTAGITRLFSKNILSDQIVWFLPLSILGFIAAAIVEKLRFPFNNRKKLDLIMWILWLVPEFIYFSYTRGLFHQYYLTMMAPPIAALSGIGLTSMWKLYKEESIRKWLLLPVSLILEGLLDLLMLSYFNTTIPAVFKGIITAAAVMCLASSVLLIIYRIIKRESLNQGRNINFARVLASLAFIGILITPAIGSSAAVTHGVNGSMPAAGLELLSSSGSGNAGMRSMGGSSRLSNTNEKLIKFLDSHVKNERYALVVSSSNTGAGMIIESGKSVMPLGGFSGSDKILSLSEFKQLVKKGEIRYVLTGGMGRDSDDIMSWVEKNGKAVPENQWKNTTSGSQENRNIQGNFNNAQMNSQMGNGNKESNNGNKQSNELNGDANKNAGTNKDESGKVQNSGQNGFGGMGMNSQTLYDLQGTVK
ncbi:glycosyltransferase family 39 protein [Clostridium sp. JNZ X4-2]